jgi:DNA-binding response OmpR family regulator
MSDPKESSGRTVPTILIIDDEAQVRVLLKSLLERAGYLVDVAGDGKEGMRLFRQKRHRLVITDLIMPEKEGIETISELRAEPDVPRIIAVSGGGRAPSEGYLLLAKRLGADATLRKPIPLNVLLGTVRELIGVP